MLNHSQNWNQTKLHIFYSIGILMFSSRFVFAYLFVLFALFLHHEYFSLICLSFKIIFLSLPC